MLIKLTKPTGETVYIESECIIEIEQVRERKGDYSLVYSVWQETHEGYFSTVTKQRAVQVKETPDAIVAKIEYNTRGQNK